MSWLRRILFLCLLFVIAGCESGGNDTVTNLTPTGPAVQVPNNTPTGSVVLRTELEDNAQALAQSVVTIESAIVPTEVTQFRITGVNAANELVFGPVVLAKAAEITVPGVPVTVTRLRVELLIANEVVVGAFSQSVAIVAQQTLEVEDPTFVFAALVGETGPQGSTGPSGPQGPTGPQGPGGPDGTDGTDGAPGATGPQGPQGNPGAQGPQGNPGAQGPAGTNGTNGTNGVDGTNGTNGTNGVDGTQGPEGPQGTMATAYGTFRFAGSTTSSPIDFNQVESSNGVYRAGTGLYYIPLDGDYLISWSVTARDDGGSSGDNLYLRSSNPADFFLGTFVKIGNAPAGGFSTQSAQFIVSLPAGERIEITRSYGTPTLSGGILNIVRIGPGPDPGPAANGIEMVSVSSTGQPITENIIGISGNENISANGNLVVFATDAESLVAGDDNSLGDVFVRDRTTGVTSRVSVDSNGAQQEFDFSLSGCSGPTISDDGRWVTYQSDFYDLVAGDSNDWEDIFLYDRQTGATTRVSVVDGTGAEANDESFSPSISSDGRYVAFASYADNLVTGDTNNRVDIFRHDTQTGATTRVSLATGGTQATGDSWSCSISADGRYVAFSSSATDLVAGDTNTDTDVFVHDTLTGETTRVSVANTTGAQATGGGSGIYGISISSDGRYVAFDSDAIDLVAGDTNGRTDAFVRDTQTGATTRVSVDSSSNQGDDRSTRPSLSADGRYVAFDSEATNLVAGDTNGNVDVFVRDTQTGTTVRASVDRGGAQGHSANSFGGSVSPSISADGRVVAFFSDAVNLVVNDTNDWFDAFVVNNPLAP